MQKEVKPLKIKATLMWAFLDQRNDLSGAYQVDLTQLSKAAVDALSEVGIEARHDENRGYFITAKSKNFPIEAQTPDGERIPEDVRVGNGSKATVVLGWYEWKFKNKTGVSPSIKKLVVTDLVKYVRKDEDAVDVDDDGTIENMESDIL